MSNKHLETLRQVADLPTAPFAETCVVEYIRRFVAGRPELHIRTDRFGNLLVKYVPRPRAKTVPKGRPVLFAAHMDHPGFIAGRMLGPGRLHSEWAGGVQARYFKNRKIKFWSQGRWIHGTVARVICPRPAKPSKRAPARSSRADAPPEAVEASVSGTVRPGSPGMWDLPDAVIRGHRFRARVTDDLAGLAAILCALDEVSLRRSKAPCYALFTRAEEVGFAGALAALEGGTIPSRALVIAVENSKALPGVVELGDGPVLRVGDKMTVFSPAVTAYCRVVADRLAGRDRTFRYQRKLMDGGSCESTAYCHYGRDANCLCLPLLNYHNMDPVRRTIAPEAIDVRDYFNLVKWFVALAESPARLEFDTGDPVLAKRLSSLLRKHRPRLLKT